MEITDFSQPVRQSSKGIIIIFGVNIVRFFKKYYAILIALGVLLAEGKLSSSLLFMSIGGILILILIWTVLKYLNFKFHLSKNDFHLSTGIINKDNTIIPKSKIQNVYIKQNVLQQMINVVSLSIETAGDKKSEIEINALDKPTALRLKKLLFNKAYTNNEQTESTLEKKVFFRVSSKRLLLEGISQNHFKSLVIIVSFVFGLHYQFKDYINKLRLQEYIEGFIELNAGRSLLHIIVTSVKNC